ncbi:hypothetical protein Zmor_015580 [Zophobas morio]|uniref:Uncharacterized protein n=1 Tax=Zophobas morio TaxID=2755281 RepID=A0AA38IGZ4_9CUCU|nr:hypothetical protein Zmor_015580 [Zophobas morio]
MQISSCRAPDFMQRLLFSGSLCMSKHTNIAFNHGQLQFVRSGFAGHQRRDAASNYDRSAPTSTSSRSFRGNLSSFQRSHSGEKKGILESFSRRSRKSLFTFQFS